MPRGAARRREGPQVVRLPRSRARRAAGPRARQANRRAAADRAHRIRDARSAIGDYTSSTRLPLLSEGRQAHAGQHAFLLAHLGDGFRLEDLSQTHIDTFARARRAGELGAKKRKPGDRGVRDDTTRQNLTWLASLLRWARGFRTGGRRLMTTNPLDGVRFPREKNVRRPVASEERYRKTLEKAPAVDPTGRLEALLALARYTASTRYCSCVRPTCCSRIARCDARWPPQASIPRSRSTCLTARSAGARGG
jgi:hypothetical protein